METISRSSSFHNEFDSISEPGARPTPAFMRRTKKRRTRTVIVTSLVGVLLLTWGWKSSGITIVWSRPPVKGTLILMPFTRYHGVNRDSQQHPSLRHHRKLSLLRTW